MQAELHPGVGPLVRHGPPPRHDHGAVTTPEARTVVTAP